MTDSISFKVIREKEFASPDANVRVLTAAEALALSALLCDNPVNANRASEILRDLTFYRLHAAGASEEAISTLLEEVGGFILQEEM